MADKLPDRSTERQRGEPLPTWDQQAAKFDAIRELRALQAEAARVIDELGDPGCSGERSDELAAWAIDLCANARGHKSEQLFARMGFFEVINNAAIEVRDQDQKLPSVADRALLTCANSWARYWSKSWAARGSGPAQRLFQDAISAWVQGVQWTQSGGTSTLALLRGAGLIDKTKTLTAMKVEWTSPSKWPSTRAGRLLRARFPYRLDQQPTELTTAKGKGPRGPKAKWVTRSVEDDAKLVNSETYRQQLVDRLHSNLPGTSRDGIAGMLTKADATRKP